VTSVREAPVLVVNAGSTSTKLAVLGDGDTAMWSCDTEPGAPAMQRALDDAGAALQRVVAVGHRIVHGGERFVEPVVVDDAVVDEIDALADLAPLHNEAGLAAMRAARDRLPSVPHVVCFDTAFHATLPDAARAYGGPGRWLAEGLRRYGFHGLSHEYASGRAAQLLGRPVGELRLVTCHLGGGCSLAAVDRGRSVDTTMGFTPLDGLVMATRSGAVDPGLLLHLLRRGTDVEELDDTLERRSGLLGLSGVSADLREVLVARDRGDATSRLAVNVFVHRLVAGIGSMAASLRGVDALVFTGGIGERSAEIRARAVDAFSWLGAAVDDATNGAAGGDADVSARDARVRVLVVTAREDLVIARATRSLLLST
jgi:acetate kinase